MIYFKDEVPSCQDGFIASRNFLWRTNDGGLTWWKNATTFNDYIYDMIFKDRDTGWLTCSGFYSSLNNVRFSTCYKTIDGGNTWFPLSPMSSYTYSIYYSKKSGRLFMSSSDGNGTFYTLYSDDEGTTWNVLLNNVAGGFAFVDDMNGFISSGDAWNNPKYRSQRTSDGGLTWAAVNFGLFIEQPVAITNSGTYLGATSLNQNPWIYRTDDYGKNWYVVFKFPITYGLGGMIAGDSNMLYVQEATKVYTSVDTGKNWQTICGPGDYGYYRFYVREKIIFSPDQFGGVWVNHTSKANAPRLSFANNFIHSSTGAIISSEIRFPAESYFEDVGTLQFSVCFTRDLLGFEYVAPSAGWKMVQCTSTDSSISCIMKFVGSGQPTLNSSVASLYFKTYLSRDTSGIISFDEINFNGDTTFRECMVASLSANDTLHVSLNPSCGDSILRQTLLEKQELKIVSVHPNPSQDEIDIELQSSLKQEAKIEIFDALGVRVFSDVRNINSGSNSIHLDTKGLSGGMYVVRVGEASQSFVKVK
ncbi:MAG: T9SS type A sorting domain-containing protein [Ignavibacteriota bacterium]